MPGHGDQKRRPERQRARRMSQRICGHCGRQADEMLAWGGQTIGDLPSLQGPPRLRPSVSGECIQLAPPAGQGRFVSCGRIPTL